MNQNTFKSEVPMKIIQNENNGRLDVMLETVKAPFSIRLFLGIFMVIGFLTPVAVFILNLYKDIEFGFSFVTTVIIGLLVGFYLLRLILWNTYGKEYLAIYSNRINYQCDYKYFKGSKKTIQGSQIRVEPKWDPRVSGGKLKIMNENGTIETSIHIPEEKLTKLVEDISARFRESG